MMVKRTNDPRQLELVLAFPEPITVVAELRPSGPTFGMPVSLDWYGPASIAVTTPENTVLGDVLGHLVQTLGRILSAVNDEIEATLGQVDDRSFEVIVMRTTDDGTFRNVVHWVAAMRSLSGRYKL